MTDISSQFKYFAFISYSHQDKKWGDWLHKALETYKVPRKLVGTQGRDGAIPKKLFPVFRDREELPGSSDLGQNINDALRQSRYLVVICSPNSARSIWVNQEISTFKAMGKENRVLCLIVDGEPNATDMPDSGLPECFPDAVRFYVGSDGELTSTRVEPIAADARPGKDGKRNSLLKLLAGLLGVSYDILKRREIVRKRWRIVQACFIFFLVTATVLGVWYRGYSKEQLQRTEKLREESVKLAVQAQEEIDDKRSNVGMHLALKGLPLNLATPERPMVRDVMVALHRAFTNNRLVATLTLNNPVKLLDFSPVGNRLIAADEAGEIVLWNTEDWRQVKQWQVKNLEAVWFDNEGQLVFIYHFGSDDEGAHQLTVDMVDAVSGAKRGELLLNAPYTPMQQNPQANRAFFSAERSEMQGETLRSYYTVWSTKAGNMLIKDAPGNAGVDGLVFDDGRRVLIPDDNNGVAGRIYSLATGDLISTLELPRSAVGGLYSYTFSTDGALVAAAGGREYPKVLMWESATGVLKQSFDMKASDLLFGETGELLVGGDFESKRITISDGNVESFVRGSGNYYIRSAENEQIVAIQGAKSVALLTADLHVSYVHDTTDAPSAVAISNKAIGLVALGDGEGRIQVLQMSPFWQEKQLSVTDILFSLPTESGDRLFVQTKERKGAIVDSLQQDNRILFDNFVDDCPLFQAIWLAHGRYLLTYWGKHSLSDKKQIDILQIRDGRTGQLLKELDDIVFGSFPDDLQASRDQKTLALLQQGHRAIYWLKLQDNEIQTSVVDIGGIDSINGFALRADGARLAISSIVDSENVVSPHESRKLSLYDYSDGAPTLVKMVESNARQILFTPESSSLIGLSEHGVHLLSADTLQDVRPLSTEVGQDYSFADMSLSADGSLLFLRTGFENMSIYDMQSWEKVTTSQTNDDVKSVTGSSFFWVGEQLYWQSGKQNKSLRCGGTTADNITMSSDLALLAYSGRNEICVLDLATMTTMLNTKLPDDIQTLYFAEDSKGMHVITEAADKNRKYFVPIRALDQSLLNASRQRDILQERM